MSSAALPAQSARPASTQWAGAALLVLLAAATVYFAAFHARFIGLPGGQEIREAAIPLTTGLILAGGQPYDLSSSPAITNVYGVVYNYVVAPAAKIWGSTFAVHRSASLVFLLIGAALLYALMRRENINRRLALAGAVFYYLFNTTTYAIVARPDTLGGVFYLAVVLLVWPGRTQKPPTIARMVLSAALGVLAFYTKPYFLLALALATAVLFVNFPWRRAMYFALGSALLLAASIPVVEHFWPYYLFEVYTSHVVGEIDPPGFFWLQTKDFLLLHAGLVAVAAGAGAVWFHRALQSRFEPWAVGWRRWWPDGGAICLMISVAALLRIGGHVGAFRIYWVQLVTPFLILVAIRAVARSGQSWRAAGLGLLALNALILLTWARPPWPLDSAPAWNSWKKLTAGKTWQLLPPAMLPDVNPPGVPVIDDGQVTYFANLALDYLPPTDPAYQRVLEYLLKVRTLIWQRRFDVIVLPNDFRSFIPPQLLRDNYDPHMVIFPIYFGDYTAPDHYGMAVRSYVAWVRKPGPKHEFDSAAPPPTAPLSSIADPNY